MHLVSKKTDFETRFSITTSSWILHFRASTTPQETETGLSLSRLPLTQPEPPVNTIGNIATTTVLPWGMVTDLQVVPQLAGRRRLVPCCHTPGVSVSVVSVPSFWLSPASRPQPGTLEVTEKQRTDLVLSDALLLKLSTKAKSLQPLRMTGAD